MAQFQLSTIPVFQIIKLTPYAQMEPIFMRVVLFMTTLPQDTVGLFGGFHCLIFQTINAQRTTRADRLMQQYTGA